MKRAGIYIIGCFLLLLPERSFSLELDRTLRIDSLFQTEELYNGLTAPRSAADKNVCIRLTLENQSKQEQQLYISIINPTLDKIIISDQGKNTVLGDLVPFTHRTFKHINHVYPLSLSARETRALSIRITPQWQAGNFRLVVSSENTFIKTTNHDNFFIGIFYGILFIYILLLICFYIFSKSNFFLLYLGILFFMLLLYFQFSGTGYQFVWFFSANIQKYITVFSVLGYLTLHMSFIRSFFSLKFRNIFSGMAIKILLYALLSLALIVSIQLYKRSFGNLPEGLLYYVLNGIFLLYGLAVITLCIRTYRESGRREVLWVLTGMCFHLANWILFINNAFGMLYPINLADNFKLFYSHIFLPQLSYLLSMLEVFIVSFFLAINYHNLIRQNNLSTQRLEFLQKRNINRFVLGQEAEREKISAGIGSVISKDIEHLKRRLNSFGSKHGSDKLIPAILGDIGKTLEDLQNITSNYVAPDMEQMRLSELITTATDKLYSELDVLYDFQKIPEDLRLNAVANINLYRILQEISNNILKHANAKQVLISAIRDGKSLQIKISDDGVGFSDSMQGNKGIGLMNIESRMSSLNGNFYVRSDDRNGSSLYLIMPLKEIS